MLVPLGCDPKADAIELVRQVEGISFNHTVELLKDNIFGTRSRAEGPPPKHSTVRLLARRLGATRTTAPAPAMGGRCRAMEV
jgi:hypothetical protein